MERNEIIAELLKNGGIRVNSLKIKNVTVTPKDEYVRLAFTLDKPVKAMVKGENDQFVEGENNVIFVSLYSITSLLKDNDDAAFAVNHLTKNPDSMSVILSRGKIDVILEKVVAGQQYKNPWSTNGTETVIQHDTFIPHVIKLELSDFGVRKLDKIADSLLGI